MIIWDIANNEYRAATPEEITKFEALAAGVSAPAPTPEEKIAALLAAIEGGIKDA